MVIGDNMCISNESTANVKKKVIEDVYYKKIAKYKIGNRLLRLLKDIPHEDLDWRRLTLNRNIMLEHFLENPDLPWYRPYMILNSDITLEMTKTHPELEWDFSSEYFHYSKKCTLDFIESHPEVEWKWDSISCNPNVTPDFIVKHKDKEWDWTYINVKELFTIENYKKYPEIVWDRETVSLYANLSRELLTELHYMFKWKYVLRNNTMSIEFYDLIPEHLWDNHSCCKHMSKVKDLTLDFIHKHPHIKWDWEEISENNAFTVDIIDANLHLNWSFCRLSYNENITSEFLEKHIDKDWDWSYISGQEYLTFDILQKYPEKPWHFQELSYSTNIPFEKLQTLKGYTLCPNMLCQFTTFQRVEENRAVFDNWNGLCSSWFIKDYHKLYERLKSRGSLVRHRVLNRLKSGKKYETMKYPDLCVQKA